MWLEVIGRYGGEVVYSSGRWIDGQGLEGDPQQRTYEGVAVEHATDTRFHLLRNNRWVVDTRIPPKGLIIDVETDPVGGRYALLPDQTWANFDVVDYQFSAADVVDATPADENDDEMELSVRLLYLINTPEYVEFLADENVTNEAGQAAMDLFAGLGTVDPVVVASWSQTVPLTGLMAPTPETTSGGSSSGGEASSGGSSSGVVPTTGGAPGSEGGSTDSSVDGGLEAGGGSGGCGCRQDGAGGLLALGLLGLRRRRRR